MFVPISAGIISHGGYRMHCQQGVRDGLRHVTLYIAVGQDKSLQQWL